MIPIRDTTLSRSMPVVTWALIGLNSLVFFVQWQMDSVTLQHFAYRFGLVPATLTLPDVAVWFSLPGRLVTFVSYMFLHGGFWHFAGNMWFLYLFGDNVEDHLGPFRYLGFYLAGGIISALCHFLIHPVSTVPTIGASGAIAAVMGGYFVLYPRARILTLIPIIIIPWFVEIPAFLFLGFWFVMQFFNAAAAGSAGSGIAWWAHVGGFAAGLLLIRLGPHQPVPQEDKTMGNFARRRTTPKLQVIQVRPAGGSPVDLEGDMEITTVEALSGTRKLVNIPWGFYKRMYRVRVPAGVRTGSCLRLKGMGRAVSEGQRGDLYLTVKVRHGI